jgi:uncharacterized protein
MRWNARTSIWFVWVACGVATVTGCARPVAGPPKAPTASDRSRPDGDGESLRRAAAQGNLALVDELIARGIPVDAAEGDGTTALQLAVLGGHLPVVDRLLFAGADVRAKVVPQGLTALHVAVRRDRADIAKALIAAGADVEAKTAIGSRPLHVASRNGAIATLDVLIERGAAVDAPDQAGLTALHMAVVSHRAGAVKRLLAHRANIEARDATGASALLFAVMEGDQHIALQLLERGANVNVHNDAGMTPLHGAALEGHGAMVKLLLARGADVVAVQKDGLIPIAFSDNVEVFELLRGLTIARKGSDLVPGLPRRVIEDTVAGRAEAFRKCHDDVLRQRPSTFGTVLIQFSVATDGRVTQARESAAESSIRDSALVACVVRAFKQLRFPAPIGGAWETTFPLRFEKREGLSTKDEGPAA